MDLVKPWLGEVLLSELKQVLQWRDEGDNLQLPGAKIGNLSFEDDGSQLIIRPENAPQIVQILKFQDIAEPVKVAVSDSRIRMTAVFSSVSTQEYKKKSHQEIYKDTLGAVFQLLQYELRATSIGPQRSRLTLYVLKFKNLGAAGSGAFGQIPRSIEDDFANEAPALLAKVATQRKQRDSTDSQGPSTRQVSPRSNSLQGSVRDHELVVVSQSQPDPTTFATQLPRAQPTIPPLSPSGRVHINGLGTSILKPKTLDQETSRLPNTNTPKPISNAELLNSLAQHELKRSSTLSGTSGPLTRQSHSSVKDQRSLSTGPPLACKSPDGQGSTQQTVRDSTPSSVPQALPFHSQPLVQDTCAEEKPTSNPLNLTKDRQNSETDNRVMEVSNLAISYHETAVRKVMSRGRQPSRKISTRDIKISKDQDEILSRPDSWLPPEPGQREPIANIPISILNTLNGKADRYAERPQSPKTRQQLEPKLPTALQIKRTPNKPPSLDSSLDQILPWSSSPSRPPPDSSLPLSQDDQQISPQSINSPRWSSKDTADSNSQIKHVNDGVVSPEIPTVEAASHQDIEEHGGRDDVGPISPERLSPLEGQASQIYHCRAIGCSDRFGSISDLGQHLKGSHEGFDHAGNVESKLPETLSPQNSKLSENLLSGISPVSNASPKETSSDSPTRPSNKNSRTLSEYDQVSDPYQILLPANSVENPQPSSSSESELEFTVPRAMGDFRTRQIDDQPMIIPPSAAAEPQIPFTQVKRTPYMNGQIREATPKINGHQGSPLDKNDDPCVSGSSLEKSEMLGLPGSTASEVRINKSVVEDPNGMMDAMTSCDVVSPTPSPTHDYERESSSSREALDNGPKRRKLFRECSPKFAKRPKLSDLFPDFITQIEEQPLNLKDKADQYRRDFFTSRRSSAPSMEGSKHLVKKGPFPSADISTKDMSQSSPFKIQQQSQSRSRSSSRASARFMDTSSKTLNDFQMKPEVSTLESTQTDSGYVMKKSSDHHSRASIDLEGDDVHAGASMMQLPTSIEVTSFLHRKGSDDPKTEQTLQDNGFESIEDPNSYKKDKKTLETGERSFISPSEMNAEVQLRDTEPTIVQDVLQLPKHSWNKEKVVDQIAEAEKKQSSSLMLSRNKAPEHKSKILDPIKQPQIGQTSLPRPWSIGKDDNPASELLFHNFKTAYPGYLGSLKHFKSLCKRIKRLIDQGGCLQQFLWDDFIIRQKTEYSGYVQRCADDAEDPLSYEMYYTKILEEPLYTKKIVTARNLHEALSLESIDLVTRPEYPQCKREIMFDRKTKDSLEGKETLPSKMTDLALSLPVPKSTTSAVGDSKPPPIMIDLTIDKEPAHTMEAVNTKVEPSAVGPFSRSHRSLPWSIGRNDSGSGSSFENLHSSPPKVAKYAVEDQYTASQGHHVPSQNLKEDDEVLGEAYQPRSKKKEREPMISQPGWWLDKNTPFNAFARNFKAIRPGNGNSFAKATDLEPAKKAWRNARRYTEHRDLLDWMIE